MRSIAAAAVAIVLVLSLLSTDFELGSVGYVHRYTASAAEKAAAAPTEPVATTSDPVAACADNLEALLRMAEAWADYDSDGRVDHQSVMQELAQLIGAQDPRFEVLATAYANLKGNSFQNGGAAALRMYREELEECCRANSSVTESSGPRPESAGAALRRCGRVLHRPGPT